MIKKQYSILFLCALMCAPQRVKAEMSTTSKILASATVSAVGIGGIATVVQWWNLGSRLDELQMRKKVGTLLERNVWLSPYDFTSGYALWGSFTKIGSRKEKDTFRQQLLEEICRAEGIDRNAQNMHLLVTEALDRSLFALQEELNRYAFLTPLVLHIARGVGFIKNPQELITSDYIIDYPLSYPKPPLSSPSICAHIPAPAERIFDAYMENILLPIDIKYAWSPLLGARIPYWFTWTHKKAAECAFEVLQQYARIRAIQRVMEQYLSPHIPAQSINLNVKNR